MGDFSGDSLLTIPLKTTTETDWVYPLKTLFKQAKISQNFDGQLSEFHRLRLQVVSSNLEKTVFSLEALQRYHDQVVALETKVPSALVKVEFTWMDAFDKGSFFGGQKYISLPFITFEQMCIQFNIAALQSHLAAERRVVDSDEELKTAAKYFQSSAGILAHLGDLVTILPEEALTGDIHPNTLAALSSLMLAQAQEIFAQKVIKGKMKDSTIAKICTEAEAMFGDAILKMTKDNVKHLFDRSWLMNVAGKQLTYGALSQFFQGKVCNVNKDIGEEIARMNYSVELFKKAQEKTGNYSLFTSYITEATRLAVSAKKDNDFIYHMIIPTTEKLAPIEHSASARLAKAAPVPTQFSSNFRDLFETLSPIFVGTSGKPVTQESENNPSKPRSTIDQLIASPLKQALDASLSAMGSYLLRYVEKQQQQQQQARKD